MKNFLFSILFLFASTVVAAPKPTPNIVIILGHEIGYHEFSSYNGGKLSWTTPNIDKISNGGGLFKNYYAQDALVAGRSAIMTGLSPFRTGYIHDDNIPTHFPYPTLDDLLREKGYTTYMAGGANFDGAMRVMEDSAKTKKPFYLFLNTEIKKTIPFDSAVGVIANKLEELKLTDETIVIVTTVTGPSVYSIYGVEWTQKEPRNTFWEVRFRVPAVIRWPGVIQPGSVFKGLAAHEDLLPTLLAAVGIEDAKLFFDGYNLKSYVSGEVKNSPRREFIYWNNNGDLAAIRYDNRKLVFMEQGPQKVLGTPEPFKILDYGKYVHLEETPFPYEDYEPSDLFHWWVIRDALFVPSKAVFKQMIQSLDSHPAKIKSPNFGFEDAIKKIELSR